MEHNLALGVIGPLLLHVYLTTIITAGFNQ
jgi:hypothetical protein